VKGLLVVSVLCLVVGVGLICGYCNGTTGMSLGYPVTGSSIHIDITTTGVPMLGGVVLTLGGAFLLVIAWVMAFIGLFKRNETMKERRTEPFVE
jgi:hypothetical protein